MKTLDRLKTPAALLLLGWAAISAAPGGPQVQEVFRENARRFVVSADAGWVDAGLDVEQGDELYFQAAGEISLQKGNPAARCGPEGLDLRTVQQPILDQNLGALIGKVSQLIAVKIDEDTGEEIRDEIVSLFHVGAGGRVIMPIRGRVYLGINENVVKDNSGDFTVVVVKLME